MFFILFSQICFASFFTQSLQELGYNSGITFKQNVSQSQVYFRIPSKQSIQATTLVLNYQFSPILKSPSSLKVYINDIPYAHYPLSANDNSKIITRSSRIKIKREHLVEKFNKISFEVVNMITGDPCIDTKFSSGLVHISEKTSVNLQYSQARLSTWDFLVTLNSPVVVRIPSSTLTEQELLKVIKVYYLLNKLGKEVLISTKAQNAPVVFSREDQSHPFKLERVKDSNEKILRSYLEVSINKNFDVSPLVENLGRTFNRESERGFQTSKVSKQSKYLSRDQLGLSAKGDLNSVGSSWSFNIPKRDGLRARALHLSLIMANSTTNVPNMAYIYVGTELIKIIRLRDSSLAQYHIVELPEKVTTWPAKLEVVVRRSDIKGSCDNSIHHNFDLRLLEDSFLEFSEVKSLRSSLSQFARDNQQVNLMIDQDMNYHYSDLIHHLAWLIKQLHIDPDQIVFNQSTNKYQLQLLAANKRIDKPIQYLLDYEFKKEDLEQSVLLQGEIQKGQHIVRGHVFGELFKPKNLGFTTDFNDIVIYGPQGIDLMTTNKDIRKNVNQFAQSNELALYFNKYRYYLLAILWLLVTFIFIKVGKRFK